MREPEDVVLYLDPSGKTASNVPVFGRDWLSGSIDCWGYGGTGPHYLAMDILRWFGMDAKLAWGWAGEFIIDFIDFLPKEGATIPKVQIQAFVRDVKSGARQSFLKVSYQAAWSRRNERASQFKRMGGF